MAGDIFFQEKQAFSTLLLLDRVRGRHSTGVAVIKKDNESTLMKVVGGSENLISNREWFNDEGEIKEYSIKVLIGHNRYATMGAKTAQNAHPFEHGDIIGAHNGTLQYVYELPSYKKFDVDSEAIFYNFDKIGVRETVSHMNGAWALTWYDKESDTMNFLRNKERPLYYVYSKDESTMFWASQEWMLDVALSSAHIKYGEINLFDENIHHTLDMKGGGSVKNKEFTYDDDPMLGFTPPVVKPSVGAVHSYGSSSQVFKGNHSNHNSQNVANGVANQIVPVQTVAKMNSYIRKDIEFFVKGERKDGLGVEYILCESVASGEYWEIRIYTKDMKRWNQLKNSKNSSWTAIVKKVVDRWDSVLCKNETYMLLDMRTLSDPIPWMAEDQDFLVLGGAATGTDPSTASFGGHPWLLSSSYTGYKGVALDYPGLIEATRNGCDWCCEDPTDMHDPKDLLWIGNNQFVCPCCNKDGNASAMYQYLT